MEAPLQHGNYEDKHDEYYRLWRGIWVENDKTRQSERSRIIAPALQQAVESAVAEIETASFSQAFMFDIEDSQQTPPPPPQGQQPMNGPQMPMMGMGGGPTQPTKSESIAVRDQLHKDLERANYRAAIGEILINAAVYGTGIGELVIEDSRNTPLLHSRWRVCRRKPTLLSMALKKNHALLSNLILFSLKTS